ncbi:MAG: 30S ribosomal protein S12 methylthiotransferase RimO [Lachnospiraceae bacterium]|nr:30S ribosomal protein S12 methylthiotransferase RimO [Lachnospiraceae bacterium]
MEKNRKISFVSLGCDKNAIDSEIMVKLLKDHGYEITKDDALADVIVINTCAFIDDAKEESINTIIEMGEYKETGCCRALVVTGCLAQRYADEIFTELPEVDAVVGTGSYEKICETVDALLEKQESQLKVLCPLGDRPLEVTGREITTPGYFEYLRIAVGCDNHCTYCIIPKLRGPYRSRDRETILQEARWLAEQGVKELMLVAQDVTKYGKDRQDDYRLPQLLTDLCRIDGLEWIRLLYCYPEDVSDELIAVMKQEPKICHYIDMPIQHCSDTVLKRMLRHHDKALLKERIGALRREIPDICIRTTLITGFPGETEEEFEEMKQFIEESRFDRLGVFTYSQEENTPAALMKDQISEDVKEERKAELMALQQEISQEISGEMVDRELEVLVEGRIPDEEEEEGVMVYSARTYRDAPDIDGFLFLTSEQELRSGDMVRCRVIGAYEYDLIGELL